MFCDNNNNQMVSGKYLTSPILLINLAGEMLYILHQRLITQSLS